MSLEAALNIVQVVLAIVLILAVLLQTKGSTFSGIFGGDSTSVYRTRRGFEKRLFQMTIVVSVVFFIVALINSIVTQV
ncbi:MAG: preprotein translocase subunit SecG [Chloroflexia bacterium]|nr:preprotein translocase subunit SecG [Chloroflexia bacterium]